VPFLTIGLVHGLGENAAIWNRLVEGLPDDIAVWSFGLPWDAAQGTGWALEREPRIWLERALALAPVAPDVFVAHSFGANVLMDHLCRGGAVSSRGAGPQALVLVSPFYRPTSRALDWGDLTHYLNDFDDLLLHGLEAMRGNLAPPAGHGGEGAGPDRAVRLAALLRPVLGHADARHRRDRRTDPDRRG
jgi:alpha-beta hydrolase superfamily lysophospholipase